MVLVGGGAFTAYTAIQNASAPPTKPLTLDEMAQMLGSDPFGSDLQSDMLKAQAAQALKADKIAAERENRKALNQVKIVDEAPGGGGFNPQQLPPGTSNPTGNRALGKQMLESRGWAGEWGCLEKLWMKESGWNERAMNTSSGAYGIPQSLPRPQDGQRRKRLADQRGHPDRVGARLHQGPLRLALWCLGPFPGQRLVLRDQESASLTVSRRPAPHPWPHGREGQRGGAGAQPR
ncbi:hypothetical protein GCM10018952_75620 [Streptosporangium vulgare]